MFHCVTASARATAGAPRTRSEADATAMPQEARNCMFEDSLPLEGSAKAPHVGAFAFRSTCRFSRVRRVWSRLWSFRVGEALAGVACLGRREANLEGTRVDLAAAA